jgi:hypothetical protein
MGHPLIVEVYDIIMPVDLNNFYDLLGYRVLGLRSGETRLKRGPSCKDCLPAASYIEVFFISHDST